MVARSDYACNGSGDIDRAERLQLRRLGTSSSAIAQATPEKWRESQIPTECVDPAARRRSGKGRQHQPYAFVGEKYIMPDYYKRSGRRRQQDHVHGRRCQHMPSWTYIRYHQYVRYPSHARPPGAGYSYYFGTLALSFNSVFCDGSCIRSVMIFNTPTYGCLGKRCKDPSKDAKYVKGFN